MRIDLKCVDCDGHGKVYEIEELWRSPGEMSQFPPWREVKVICDKCYGQGDYPVELEDWEDVEDYRDQMSNRE